MELRIGTIHDYNNEIVIATDAQDLVLNDGVNTKPVPPKQIHNVQGTQKGAPARKEKKKKKKKKKLSQVIAQGLEQMLTQIAVSPKQVSQLKATQKQKKINMKNMKTVKQH